MKTMHKHLASSLAGTLILLALACSSKNNNNNPVTLGTGGQAAATGGGTSTDGGSSSTTGGSSSTNGGSSSTGGTTAAGGGACVQDSTKTCHSCPATTNDEFLNECSSATCYPFDNAGKGVPSSLPAIP